MSGRGRPDESLRHCPKCNQKKFYVTESRRRSQDPTLRFRRRCSNCNYAETKYEITATQMKEYDLLLRLNTAISQVLNPPISESRKSCTSCSYWIDGSCSMQFPESGGSFASECSLYEPNQHQSLPVLRKGHSQSRDLRGVLSQDSRR